MPVEMLGFGRLLLFERDYLVGTESALHGKEEKDLCFKGTQ